MQLVINLLAFFLGCLVGYLLGYYVRMRRVVRVLHDSISTTLREQEVLRAQYDEVRASIEQLKKRYNKPPIPLE